MPVAGRSGLENIPRLYRLLKYFDKIIPLKLIDIVLCFLVHIIVRYLVLIFDSIH